MQRAVLSSTVPIVGQMLSAAADSVLAGLQALRSGLGFAVVAVLAAQLLPLYCRAMAHMLLLAGAALAARLLGLGGCGRMLACLSVCAEVLAALLALLFGMSAAGILLMILVGNGG